MGELVCLHKGRPGMGLSSCKEHKAVKQPVRLALNLK